MSQKMTRLNDKACHFLWYSPPCESGEPFWQSVMTHFDKACHFLWHWPPNKEQYTILLRGAMSQKMTHFIKACHLCPKKWHTLMTKRVIFYDIHPLVNLENHFDKACHFLWHWPTNKEQYTILLRGAMSQKMTHFDKACHFLVTFDKACHFLWHWPPNKEQYTILLRGAMSQKMTHFNKACHFLGFRGLNREYCFDKACHFLWHCEGVNVTRAEKRLSLVYFL